jgi:excisionase family DNA binding protein
MDELLTTEDVARVLSLHPAVVRRWARHGRLRAVKLNNHQYRFRPDDIRAMLAASEVR